MNDEQIDDLKQFIATTVQQESVELRNEMKEMSVELRTEMREMRDELNQKIDDLSESVAVAIDTSNEETEKRLSDHEDRITKLKTKPA